MTAPIIILLVITVVLLPVKGIILYAVFGDEIREWWRRRRHPEPLTDPICMYCQSKWTTALDEGQTRWEGDELVLVTTYECQHCHLPFWHVERVPVGVLKR